MFNRLSLVRRLSQAGTVLATRLTGVCVGEDASGNRYYKSRNRYRFGKEKRWVMYAGEPEPSLVPPEWFGWLHYSSDQPLPTAPENRYFWQKPHQPNLSGTAVAPLPLAHPATCAAIKGEEGSYQSWTPPA